MNSQSHALDNLICLCQSCHLKEEAKVHEVWGGQLNTPSVVTKAKSEVVPRCPCGAKTKQLGTLQLCWKCWRPILLEKMSTHKMKDLAQIYGITFSMVDFILHPWSPTARKEVDYHPRVTAQSPKLGAVTG